MKIGFIIYHSTRLDLLYNMVFSILNRSPNPTESFQLAKSPERKVDFSQIDEKCFVLGKVPYVFAQHLMTACYSITDLTIHLKYDNGKNKSIIHIKIIS